jgi:hypothetical protein
MIPIAGRACDWHRKFVGVGVASAYEIHVAGPVANLEVISPSTAEKDRP